MANLIKTLSIAKSFNSKKILLPVSAATLNINDYQIEIIINGIPSVVQIEFEGAASFSSLMPLLIKSRISKNSILISNIFRHPFPKKIFNYSGDIRVLNCKIINFDGTSTAPTINNLHDTDKLGKSETNVEDEDLILFDEPKEIKSKRRSFSRPSLSGKLSTAINNMEIGKLSSKEISSKFKKVLKDNKQFIIKDSKKKPIKVKPDVIVKKTALEDKKGKY